MIQCSSLVFLKTLTRTPVTGVIVMESLFHRVHLPLSGVTDALTICAFVVVHCTLVCVVFLCGVVWCAVS